nr:uncharacterized protein LOC129254344 [Lytechinus pictus]
MSFLKKFNKQKSVDLEEELRKKEEKEKAKEMKRAKRHSVHVSGKRSMPDVAVDVQPKDDSIVEDRGLQKKKEAERKERERRKFKDMSGMVMTSPNEYPVFIVHYLGRMPADAEYGREAVEDPVHQLCKLREKQKLQKTLLAFNVDGMMCREVSGPFYKPKKEGLTFFIPLHHITYGVASLTHPQVFAIISKMTDDPSPANQVLVLHAFLCDKTEDAQGLTYWQLQAYIEAFEDLKRKKMLKQRRKQAMHGPPIPPGPGTSGDTPSPASIRPSPDIGNSGGSSGSSTNNSKHKNPPTSPSPASPKGPAVKPKRTNSAASITSSSSSSASSSSRVTPTAERKTPDKDEVQDVVQMSKKQNPGKMKTDVWPPAPKRGPPPQLRGPPLALTQPNVGGPPATGQNGRTNSRDSAYGEGEDEFAISFSPTSATAPKSSPVTPGPVFPGIAPRRTSESDTNRTSSFENRISELQNLVEMDAEKLKDLMINEYPTLSRKIYFKMSIDQNGVVTRKETKADDQGSTSKVAAVDDVDHTDV